MAAVGEGPSVRRPSETLSQRGGVETGNFLRRALEPGHRRFGPDEGSEDRG